VLAACHGYLAVAAHLLSGEAGRVEAWNIGPSDATEVDVRTLIEILGAHWESPEVEFRPAPLHEDRQLLLDVHKARSRLGVVCPWTTVEAVRRTAAWYRGYRDDPASAVALTDGHLNDYRAALLGGAQDNAEPWLRSP
jgi:CDP-glucose 4,6-dehydratase